MPSDPFSRHGFARVAAAVPQVRLADADANADSTLALARAAAEDDVALLVCPELGLTGYSNQDLFHQQALLESRRARALRPSPPEPPSCPTVLVVGPAAARRHAAVQRRRGPARRCGCSAIVPKSYLPNYREFYEKRHFSAARQAIVDQRRARWTRRAVRDRPPLRDRIARPTSCSVSRSARTSGRRCRRARSRRWRARPWWPTSRAATSPSARPDIDASSVRRSRRGSSARTSMPARARSESTTDLAWDGHAIVAENGNVLAESDRLRAGAAARHRRHRPRPAGCRPAAHDELRRLPGRPPAASAVPSGPSRARGTDRRGRRFGDGCRGSRSCPATPRSGRSGARRSTPSSAAVCGPGCRRAASSAS